MKKLFFLILAPLFIYGGFMLISAEKSALPTDENNYESNWRKVDSLEKKGLYRMALTEVNTIFSLASKSEDHNQVIKAVLFELKYNSYLEEDDYVLGLDRLNDLIKEAPSPSKEILHSLAAEVYWGYYSANSWKFADRTNVIEADLADVRTWDLERISEKVIYHYFLSLRNPSISQSRKISAFEAILNNSSYSNEIRPTLYDFLSFRAFDFFKSNTFNIGGNVKSFSINSKEYFGSNSTFEKINPEISDSLNTKFWAFRVVQELTKFHAQEDDKTPLIHVELERLKFVKSNAVHSEKENLFYDGLIRMTNVYSNNAGVAEVWYEIASFHNNLGNQYNFLADTTQRWEKKKALEICAKTIEKYPGSHGAQQCLALKSQIQLKEISTNINEVISPNTKGRIRVNYKNIDQAFYKIIKIDNKKYWQGNYKQEDLMALLKSNSGVQSKTIALKNPKDFQLHSTEINFEALDNGFYYLVVSTDPNFDNNGEAFIYSPFWVTDITYQTRGYTDSNEVLVLNRVTGKPIVGAKAKVTYEKYNYTTRIYDIKTVGVFATDENGKFTFEEKERYNNYFIEISTDNDFYEPRNSLYNNYYKQNDYNRYEIKLFTDRKIYRPGQSVYFKGIAVSYVNEKRELLVDRSFTVYFKDVNGQEVGRKEVKTNAFGSFEGEFTAPFGVLTGLMSITCYNSSTNFRVEEYKRPKFTVKMKPIEGEFQINDSIKAVGQAQAYAGNAIDGAIVKYRVTRSTAYSNRWWYWGWYPQPQAKEVAQGETTTDENGEFKVNFKAFADETADKKLLPLFTYTIYADVTDINGETHTTTSSVMVGFQSLILNSNIPEELENNEVFNLRVNTSNLNGQRVNANGKVTIHSLIQPKDVMYNSLWGEVDMKSLNEKEFKALFPDQIYAHENDYHSWEKGQSVFSSNFNTAKSDSLPIKDFTSWKPGVYVYEARTKDKNGIEIIDQKYFTVFNRNAATIPTNDLVWVKQLNYSAEPGEMAKIIIGTAEKDMYVRVEIEHNNAILETRILPLNQEQKLFEYEVKEAFRGNFAIHITALRKNQYFYRQVNVAVPYTNKRLDLSFSTFRDKLKPGEEEEWIINIKNASGGNVEAELLAALYDASLDALYTPNDFYMNLYAYYYARRAWNNPTGLGMAYGYNTTYYWNKTVSYPYRYFPTLNYHGFSSYYYGRNYYRYDYDYYEDDAESEGSTSSMDFAPSGVSRSEIKESNKVMDSAEEVLAENAPMVVGDRKDNDSRDKGGLEQQNQPIDASISQSSPDLSTVAARTNFNETAFFYPQLTSDANGNVKVKFTIPESLTKWNFIGLAHTKDLKFGNIKEEVVTQKELMVVPNMPRFLREGDKITLSTKISNISEEDLTGKVQLFLIDPFTEKPIDVKFHLKNSLKDFSTEKGKSTSVSWDLEVPYELAAVKYKVVASAGNFSDGEENALPILTNRMLVTESLPLPIRGKESKVFTFEKLMNSGQSKTLRHHRYTLEFTSNPAWYAIQAMPYMMEYPYECAEQTFTRFYSNSIATHIMNSNPKIKQVIEDWGQHSPEAFLSNLQKNQELKSVVLEETPWVLDAKSEEQSKRNLSVLLDMNRMSKELDKALSKIEKAQSSNGGWPWFPGMKENRYITQHIITGMGHLDHLGIKDVRDKMRIWNMVKNGVKYLDGEIVSDYKWIMKYASNPEDMHLGYTQIQYLYARSYFPEIGMDKQTLEAVNYFKNQAKAYWLSFNIYAEGMIALAAHRFEMKDLASDIVKSLKDRSIHSEEFGMYWKDYYSGYNWYEAPIETQALMIEMFDEVANDLESVEELKIWLLKEKQTTNWKTTKQTTEAVYALLLKGTDLLANDDLVQVTIGDKPIVYTPNPNQSNPYEVKSEAGTGYFKTHWEGELVKPEMGNIKVSKASTGVAWGAVYWQYFEDLDKITFAETNLKLDKQLFLVEVTPQGEKIKPVNDNNVVHIGDKLRVRIELRTDRNLEYVHMKDMRGAGFEPTSVLSRYKYQDGLGYYQATKDAATNFFFDYIPKGTYVFEYDLRVQHKGDFSNGITTIQCMYAPEFTSHSNGIRVIVE